MTWQPPNLEQVDAILERSRQRIEQAKRLGLLDGAVERERELIDACLDRRLELTRGEEPE